MHGVIEEANNSDHRGISYIIRVMKMGRLITQNIRHICSITIPTEQYLWEWIKKETGKLELIFMQTVPMEHIRVPQTYTVDPRAHVDNKVKKDIILPHFSRVRRSEACMSYVMTNQTASQLTIYQQT